MILEEMNVYLDTPQRYVGNVYDRLLYADQPLGWDILGTRETIEDARARRSRRTSTRGTGPSAWSSGSAGESATGSRRSSRSCLAGSSRGRPDKPRRSSSHRIRRPSFSTRRPPSRHTSSSASAAIRSGIRTATRSSSSPSCSAAGCRRASSPRCARSAASATTFTPATPPTRTRAPSTRAPESTWSAWTRRSRRSSARCGRSLRSRFRQTSSRRRAGYAKGRFVLRLESPQGTIQYGLRREVLEGEIEDPDELMRQLDAVTVDDVQRVAKDLFEDKRLYLALVGPFDDPARFESCSRSARVSDRDLLRRTARDRGRLSRHARRPAGVSSAKCGGHGGGPRRTSSRLVVRSTRSGRAACPRG